MLTIFENPDHWRQRAEEARGIAVVCNDPKARQLVLGIALVYDDLAERANERRELHQVLSDQPDEPLKH